MKTLTSHQHECFVQEQQLTHQEDLRWLFWGALSSAGVSILAWTGIVWLVMSWF